MENTTSNTNENNEELGALWKRQARSTGQTYLAGHLKGGEFGDEGQKIVVFSNKNKTNERAPDFRIYKSKPVPVSETPQSETPQSEPPQSETPQSEAPEQEGSVEEILD